MKSSLAHHRALLEAVASALSAPGHQVANEADPRVAASCRIGEALRRLPAPTPPSDLHTAAFYEGILERATAAAARDIGAPILRAAFEPAGAGQDVSWVEAGASPLVTGALRSPVPATPGWLLARIRSDLRAARPTRVRPSGTWLAGTWLAGTWAAAAAVLVLAGLFAVRHGTPRPTELVFHQVERPISTMGHPSDLLRDLGR